MTRYVLFRSQHELTGMNDGDRRNRGMEEGSEGGWNGGTEGRRKRGREGGRLEVDYQ